MPASQSVHRVDPNPTLARPGLQGRQYAVPFRVYNGVYYFGMLWDEAVEDARLYDLIDGIMRRLAQDRGMPPLEVGYDGAPR